MAATRYLPFPYLKELYLINGKYLFGNITITIFVKL